jgi:NNP family nitrate/nitrite transporter-like MFS transporter
VDLEDFFLPICFGFMNDILDRMSGPVAFMLLFVLVATALIWMHAAILFKERGMKKSQFLPELGNSQSISH